ncbi:MAG TPA: 2-succinyl-5-enolpyruvyl-6-hydroxy-3-cyclohexene-1-carboxylic-acid synthase [Acidimicrobiia bacterium]|nr:2-succinyl-5-enolpyruvyl-6-hydroxy-3-cyclohexene-1-carboxylic-acid synthase [Acidimicrobiia bacterium]
MTQPNPSTAQARAIVDELHRQGVDYVVISPGSRSAALAIAFEAHPGMTTRVVTDERSAAFHALGRARAARSPVVVLATSGTAVANHLPAVVEADLSLVPLISISADRPPELLHVGANQTMDQPGIFGGRVRWSCSIPPAEHDVDSNRYWRSSVSQAVARAQGHGARPGPVHLNVAFREPTVPVPDDGRTRAETYPFSIEGRRDDAPWQTHQRSKQGGAGLDLVGGGLIIAGEGDFDPEAVAIVARRMGRPVLATATSGLRSFDSITTYHHLLVEGVPPSLRPDFVLTVGRIGPSDRLVALTSLPVPQIQVDPWGAWQDPRRHSTHMIQADPALTLEAIGPAPDTRILDSWRAADTAMRAALDERLASDEPASGPAVARALTSIDCQILVAGSSMPIRDVDGHFTGGGRVLSNRGASGIDGFVSTAIGAATATSGGTVAFCGDLTFLHDSTGLVSDTIGDVVFVVIDNGGGGLFDLLPQSEHAPSFERLFIAPHGLDLRRLAIAYGLETATVAEMDGLGMLVSELLVEGGGHVAIVPVEREADLKTRRSLDDSARAVCAGLS